MKKEMIKKLIAVAVLAGVVVTGVAVAEQVNTNDVQIARGSRD